jgi:hypothetical protein
VTDPVLARLAQMSKNFSDLGGQFVVINASALKAVKSINRMAGALAASADLADLAAMRKRDKKDPDAD